MDTTQSQSAEQISATRQYDPNSHITWLDMDCKPEEATRAALKARGWRWSGYRKQWYTNQRWPQIPANITVEDAGECDYSSERAERLQDRADRHRAKSDAAYQRSHDLVAMIPFGQPILVGHHSERADRNRRAKSWAAMDKSVAEAKTAERLDYSARSSAAHQAHKQTPEAMQRRVDRLSADYRKMRRNAEDRAAWLKARGEQESDNDREYIRRAETIAAEIADLQQRIADAGGITADRLRVEVGDTISINGIVGRVKRVNPKTFTIDAARTGDPFPWLLKLDRSQLQRIIAKHDGSPVEEPAAIQQERERIANDQGPFSMPHETVTPEQRRAERQEEQRRAEQYRAEQEQQ